MFNVLNTIDLSQLTLQNLKAYLFDTGWKQIKHTHPRRIVFERWVGGEAIDLVLPSRPGLSDYELSMAEAVSIIGAIEEISAKEVVQRVRRVNRDIFKVRLLTGVEASSLSLDIAIRELSNLKKLFVFSASSEKEARAYFGQPLSVGKKYVKDCQFGHTFAGSFGLTIESPIKQREFKGLDGGISFERKVIERIARGFSIIKKAALYEDWSLLTTSYERGFNANMYEALIGMSIDKRMEIEYDVKWSPILDPSEDVKDFEPIRLNEETYHYLEQAVEEMKFIEPHKRTISGRIHLLQSKSDPRETNNKARTIEISSLDGAGKPMRVKISLSTADYLTAVKAHSEHNKVKVTGMLAKRGNRWELEEPHGFEIDKEGE